MTKTASKCDSKVVRFSLPADPQASSVLRMLIRNLAVRTNLTPSELCELLDCVTDAFHSTLIGQRFPGEGRMAFKVFVNTDEVTVDLVYKEVHFPPAEYVSPS